MDPNCRYGQDFAIHLAASSGILELVSWIVDKGADIWVTNGDRETARDVAHRKGYRDIVRYLEKKSVYYEEVFASSEDTFT